MVFKRADDLLDGRSKLFREKEVHVVSFRWKGFSPLLQGYQQGDIVEIDLGVLDINVSKEKICVGSFDEGYTPCPNKYPVSVFDQCQDCASPYIPKLDCIFEPSGCDDCTGGFCQEEHTVYLAFHDRYPKIGMTRTLRLKQRLIEQGADAYAILATLENRLEARKEEKDLSARLNISQRSSGKKILQRMSRKLDRSGILTTYQGVKNEVPVGDLKFLKGYPLSEPLRSIPRQRPTPGIHRGMMVGIKGRYLIYDSSGLQAIDLSDLPGRRMKIRY